jgi:hypothetical protein
MQRRRLTTPSRLKKDEINIQGKALKEFDEFVNVLRQNGVEVTVVRRYS